MIDQHERRHRLDHRNSARQDTGIVTATALEGGALQVYVPRLLLLHVCSNRLERHSKANGFAIGNAALNPAGAVSQGAHFSALVAKRIIMLQASEQCPRKTRTNLERFGSGQA